MFVSARSMAGRENGPRLGASFVPTAKSLILFNYILSDSRPTSTNGNSFPRYGQKKPIFGKEIQNQRRPVYAIIRRQHQNHSGTACHGKNEDQELQVEIDELMKRVECLTQQKH